MSRLRKLAKGQPCLVRLPGVCNGNPETTVLAHYRLANECGIGVKPIDAMGAWACSACHDAIDGRSKADLTEEQLRLFHAEGVMRTLSRLSKMGEILIGVKSNE